jgi:hypothetical protein
METITPDIHRARGDVDCALLVGCVQWQRSTGFERYVGVDLVGERLHGQTDSPGLADHYTNAFAFGFEDREIGFRVMGEGGISLLVHGRQRHPSLQTEQSRAASPHRWAGPL